MVILLVILFNYRITFYTIINTVDIPRVLLYFQIDFLEYKSNFTASKTGSICPKPAAVNQLDSITVTIKH